MIQCQNCEFFRRDENGRISFACDPFSTIVEPECIGKWQLIKTDQMVQAYHATLEYYRRLAPLQEKMFKAMEHELDDMNESDKWKMDEEDHADEEEGPYEPDR
jgi:hypothetical protein